MARIDSSLVLCDAQDVTASAASANILDMGTVQKDLGVGTPLSIFLSVVVVPVATGTYQVELRTSATQSAGALTGTILTLLTRAISATAKVGAQYEIPIPNDLYDALNKTGLLQYLDIHFTTGASGPDITVNADLRPRSMGDNYNGNLPSGFAVN